MAAQGSREGLIDRLLRHGRHLLARREAVLPYGKANVKDAPAALLSHTRVWPWINYQLVDLHGRYPNALTRRLLPEERWIGFWYVAKRLAQGYVVAPFPGPTFAVFLNQTDRLKSWSTLLNPDTVLRVIDTTHDQLVVEPALSAWMDVLDSLLSQRHREVTPTQPPTVTS